MSDRSFTVACTLTEAELASRISEFLPGLLSKADTRDDSWRLPMEVPQNQGTVDRDRFGD